MTEVTIPDKLPQWATTYKFSSVTNNPNVVEPTDSKKRVGFDAFEPPARNWFNWLFLKNYEWHNYWNYRLNTLEQRSDGNGANVFSEQNTLIYLYAVDKTTPTRFIHAVGWKGTTSHTLNVIDSDTLTLGSQDANGTQAISGATASNVVMYAKMVLPPS